MLSEPTGLINKVIPQSFVDGPGNRTAIFLQGCNLNCLFCHNPQTINLCIHCGKCIPECPEGALSMVSGKVSWNEALCKECLLCEAICPASSTPRVRQVTPQEMMKDIEAYQPFISGVTLSGGEPLLQPEFVKAFFSLVQAAGLHTMVETNGNISSEILLDVLPFVDEFMIDMKTFNNRIHEKLTGRQNGRVLETIRLLSKRKKIHAVRTTVVPDYNDTVENAARTAEFLKKLDDTIPLVFQRFRAHGTRGEASKWPSPTDELMDSMVTAALETGLKNVSRSI